MKKEIRFESGTTAITVFDKIGTRRSQQLRPLECMFRVGFPLIISQDTCRIFWFNTYFGEKSATD